MLCQHKLLHKRNVFFLDLSKLYFLLSSPRVKVLVKSNFVRQRYLIVKSVLLRLNIPLGFKLDDPLFKPLY